MEPSVSEWLQPAVRLMDASHLAEASSVAALVNEATRLLNVESDVYLVDREQHALRALPVAGRPTPDPLPINGTIAGRAFMHVRPVVRPGPPEELWLPLLDGSERLGVLRFTLPDHLSGEDPAVRKGAEVLAGVTSYVVVAKAAYGDTIRRTRRSQPMSVGGELLWRALPPLTFTTPRVSLATMLEPAYDVGGDAFDYAADFGTLRLGLFDAIGHGLTAAFTSTLTLAATRAARAAGLGLPDMAAAADEAITSQFSDTRYTTAILAELDLTTGELRYVNAGHPSAVLLRDGKAVASLEAARRTPLGLPAGTRIGRHGLEPGDRLLFYTDGITEARNPAGEFFGLERLLAMAERNAAAGLPASESVRRLALEVLEHQSGRLDDDATLMIVEWNPAGAAD